MRARKSNRGGARNTGRLMPFNTSGLNAIRFGYDGDVLRVYVAAGETRTSFSVPANGRAGACQRAIDKRLELGLPAPSLSTCMRKLREFVR